MQVVHDEATLSVPPTTGADQNWVNRPGSIPPLRGSSAQSDGETVAYAAAGQRVERCSPLKVGRISRLSGE